MGPEGFEPPPTGLKGRHAAATPRPRAGHFVPGYAFGPGHHLGPRCVFLPRVRAAGFEPAVSSSRGLRISQAFPALIVPESSPCGNRTHLSALKGRYPRPIDERAIEWAGGRSNPRLPGFNRPLDRLSYQPIPRSQRKGPVSCVTPGLRHRTRDVRGRASRPQGIERERARRLTGGSLRFHTAQGVTRTPGEHGRPRCKECLRPTRRVTALTARPVVLHPYRRGTPGDVRAISRRFSDRLSGGTPHGDGPNVSRSENSPPGLGSNSTMTNGPGAVDTTPWG